MPTTVGRVARRALREYWEYRWKLLGMVRRETTLRTKQGRLTVSTRDTVIGRELYTAGGHQFAEVSRAMTFLRQQGLLPEWGKGCVLDCGANLGVLSVGLLVAGEFESAIGVEPDANNFALLERNVAQNGLTGRYRAVRAAATDRRRDLRLSLSPSNYGDHRVSVDGGVSVAGLPLDEVAKPGEVSLLWLDVQGHETHAIRGAGRLLAAGVPAVVEVYPQGLGDGVAGFCLECRQHWKSFWVWRRCGRYVQYPTAHLMKFCEELGGGGEFDDVIFTPD